MFDLLKKSLQDRINAMRQFIFRLSRYLRLNTIIYFPVLLAVAVFVIGYLIGAEIYPGNLPKYFSGALLLTVMLIASLSGVLQIIVEEVPGLLLPVRGKFAVIIGILWIAFFWFVGILIIWDYLLI